MFFQSFAERDCDACVLWSGGRVGDDVFFAAGGSWVLKVETGRPAKGGGKGRLQVLFDGEKVVVSEPFEVTEGLHRVELVNASDDKSADSDIVIGGVSIEEEAE